jgi:hypothetical protein
LPSKAQGDSSDSDDDVTGASAFGSLSRARKIAAARVSCGSERRGGAKGTAAERAARRRRLLLACSM